MRTSLLGKLILAFVLVALVSAAVVMVFIRLTNEQRLGSMILNQARSDLAEGLAAYYQESGSWEGVGGYWQQLRANPGLPAPAEQMPGQAPPGGEEDALMIVTGEPPRSFERRNMIALADEQGRIIVAAEPDYRLGQVAAQSQLNQGTPVKVDGRRVGTLLSVNLRPRFSPEEALFIRRTNQALLVGALGAVLIAILISLLLARTLTRPLQALTEAAQRIAGGDLEQRVEVRGQDEIGRLAGAFNRMSAEVARANRRRRQMTADIAHDLRTPLTVIGGYVESMQEGVLKPTPERLGLIYAEIERLEALVDDLRVLSEADAGELPMHPQPLPPLHILQKAAASFQHRAEQQGVALRVAAEAHLPLIHADETRMLQVYANLIDNALRYTPSGGQITLSARRAGEWVRLGVTDTGEGIPAEELERIFDRFYRVDPSREGKESGLGLAIVRVLVEAHGGRVHAESQPGAGTEMVIELPAQG